MAKQQAQPSGVIRLTACSGALIGYRRFSCSCAAKLTVALAVAEAQKLQRERALHEVQRELEDARLLHSISLMMIDEFGRARVQNEPPQAWDALATVRGFDPLISR